MLTDQRLVPYSVGIAEAATCPRWNPTALSWLPGALLFESHGDEGPETGHKAKQHGNTPCGLYSARQTKAFSPFICS